MHCLIVGEILMTYGFMFSQHHCTGTVYFNEWMFLSDFE